VVSTFIQASSGDGAGVRCDQGGRSGLRYTFEIHADGSWVLFKIDDAGSKVLGSGTSVAIRTGASNTITGQCREVTGGTQLAMTVNNAVLGSTTDLHTGGPIPWHGALVVYRGTASSGTEVRFNQFLTAVA